MIPPALRDSEARKCTSRSRGTLRVSLSSDRFRSLRLETSEEGLGEGAASRYGLRIGKREVRLHHGETLIGRADECQIVLPEIQVSRRHARIILAEDELFIENHGSMNDTFLNGSEVHQRMRLRPGDRVTVGSSNIDVVEYVGAAPSSTEPSSGVDRGPESVANRRGRLARWAGSEPQPGAAPSSGPRTRSRTANLETFESAGRLADRMFVSARPHSARKILEEPLQEILQAARDGRVLDPELVDAVGAYAVKLAHEVLEGHWVDIAAEIHMHAGRPLRQRTLGSLMLLRKRGVVGDDALMSRYYERLRSCRAFMNSDERRMAEQVAALVRSLID